MLKLLSNVIKEIWKFVYAANKLNNCDLDFLHFVVLYKCANGCHLQNVFVLQVGSMISISICQRAIPRGHLHSPQSYTKRANLMCPYKQIVSSISIPVVVLG